MKKKTYILNTVLAVEVGVACLAALLVSTFAPAEILPELSIPNLVLVSLIALLVEHYMAPDAERCYICIPVFSAITFGLLPFVAGLIGAGEILKFALSGGVVFTVVTWIYSAMEDRLTSGPAAKAAPFVAALGVYLASQCFQNILI